MRITLNLNGGYIAYASKDVPYDIEPGRGWYFVEGDIYCIELNPPAGNTGTYSIELPVIRKDGAYIADYSFNYGNQQQSNGLRAKVTKSISDKSEETFWFEDGWVDCQIYPVWSENNIDYPFVVNLNGGTDTTSGQSASYWSNLTLKYGQTVTLPTLVKTGYKYQGWEVKPVRFANVANFNTGSYNGSTKKFTQRYGLYTATPVFISDSGEDSIVGTYTYFSPSYKEATGSTAKGTNYRAALGYDIIESGNSVEIVWHAYVQMHSNYQWGLGITCEGQTATGALVTSPGSTYKNVAHITGTKKVTKERNAKTITLTARAYGVDAKGNTNNTTYGKAPGSVDLVVTIDIPASTPQKVYIDLNSLTIYARDFIESTEFYIDNDGTIYAPSFNVGDSLYFDENGIAAKQFVLGIPS